MRKLSERALALRCTDFEGLCVHLFVEILSATEPLAG